MKRSSSKKPGKFDDPVTVEAREILRRLKLSPTEIAELTGKSRTQISMIRNRRVRASRSFLSHLSLLESTFRGNAPKQMLCSELDLFPQGDQERVAKMAVAFMRSLREGDWK